MKTKIIIGLLIATVFAVVLVGCQTQYLTYSDGPFSVSYPKWVTNMQGGANVVVHVNNANCDVQIHKVKIGPLGFESSANILLNIAKNSGTFTSLSEDITSSYANVDYTIGRNNIVFQISLRTKNCGDNAYAVFFSCKQQAFQKYANEMAQTFGTMRC